mmetsp:Transcript_30354/g.69848  ORF Transcript_30354/g.69848 Transcript_30354/m.69848 type:complete len:767 (-) Transcript_30354:42-2342(-)
MGHNAVAFFRIYLFSQLAALASSDLGQHLEPPTKSEALRSIDGWSGLQQPTPQSPRNHTQDHAAAFLGQTSRALTSTAQLPWWRLVCNAVTLETWRVCSLQYFTDRSCSQSSTTPVEEEWTACFPCTTGGDAYVTVKFPGSTELQCVQYAQCTTTTNGFGSVLQGQADCPQVMLQRSADGVSWTSVGDWSNPVPGVQLVRTDGNVQTSTSAAAGGGGSTGATTTPTPTASLVVVGAVPSRVSDCSACVGNGVAVRGTLTLEFNEEIQLGTGSVTFTRGSLADITTPASGGWFSASGRMLTISPQQDLAGSSECVTVSLGSGSIRSLNGQSVSSTGAAHRFCVVDYLPPGLTTSGGWQPAPGQIISESRPGIQVTFDEEVVRGPSAAMPELIRTTTIGLDVVEFTNADVQIETWNSFTGASKLVLQLTEDLEANSRYEVTIPSGFVQDVQGNLWAGGTVQFDTDSLDAPTVGTTAGMSNDGGDDSAGSVAGMVAAVVVVTLVLCCGFAAFAVWQIWLRRGQAELKAAPPAARPQAWTQPAAKSGSAASVPGGTSPGSTAQAAPPPAAPPQGPRQAGQASAWDSKLPKVNGQTFSQRMAEQAPPPPRQHRSYEAEDVRREGRRDSYKPTHTSFTEEDATGGEWIKTVDKASGKPYWYHYKTMETRWEKPVGARERSTAGGPKVDSSSEQNGLEADLSNLKEAEEVARVKAELLEQLRKNRKEDLALRKKTFKFMCFRWHPDKNQERTDLATPVFQFLQEQRGWFLDEA